MGTHNTLPFKNQTTKQKAMSSLKRKCQNNPQINTPLSPPTQPTKKRQNQQTQSKTPEISPQDQISENQKPWSGY